MILEVSVHEILDAPQFPALVEEYAAEAAIVGMPHPKAKIESYRAYDASGMLHSFASVDGDALVGFITVLAPILPHYSCPVAVAESFFVAAAHRAGGDGLRLLTAAEKRAQEVGSPGLLVSAPMDGRLFEILPRCGYVECSRIFFKQVPQ